MASFLATLKKIALFPVAVLFLILAFIFKGKFN